MNYKDFWEDSDYTNKEYICGLVTDEMIQEVEGELGYKLPLSYIELMKSQNGGYPKNTYFPTKEPTSWAKDHIEIVSIMGIGKEKDFSLCGENGSQFWIDEWGYPDIGIYICDCPSAGHDMVALDYTEYGSQGEPKVVHIDQDNNYKKTFLAENFALFIEGLQNEQENEDIDTDDIKIKNVSDKFTQRLKQTKKDKNINNDIEEE